MSSYDVVVIGAGAAGLSAGALLAKEGKRTLVLERAPYLGGRAMAAADDGFKVNLGGHLIEDSGSGLTKVFEHVGKVLIHGEVSKEMPVWDNETRTWGSIRDRYGGDKTELKKVIKVLTETSWDELEAWDDRPLREWILQHTDDQGVIDLYEFLAVLECLTDEWYDHSASDNLWVRKMHYEEKHMAAYSCWPEQGWDGMWKDLADAIVEHGGELRFGVGVDRVLIENGAVKGVALPRQPRVLPNEVFEDDVVDAECVISTLPVWNVLNVVPEWELPDWYAGQIRYLAQDRYRVSWLNLYLATEEPVTMYDERELSTWLATPHSPTPGYMFDQAAMDPDSAPAGMHLYTLGGVIPGEHGRDRRYLLDMFERFERGVIEMYPGLANYVWRRRTLVFDPSFGVIQKPMLVGTYRPHWRAPNIDGLYFASETFRSRGVGTDRAARAALTCVEDYLGRRLATFGDGWRY
ncbi:MAG: phytoene desaturase family protein [Acidimicrobiales bacterium]